jgi:DNA-binding transcriptional regulator YhcF (GntR family)
MLSSLFGSNARVKILKHFLFNPDSSFYIRQLARDLDLQVNSVRRELENLEEFGLLKSETGSGDASSELSEKAAKQEKKYYHVNKTFPLYEDIKALVAKSQVLYKDDLVKNIVGLGNIKFLLLTGVFVNKFNSPIDILIVGRVNKDKLAEAIKEIEVNLGRELNYTVMEAAEFKYRRDITDIFLYDVLEGEKIVVVDELGVS